MILPPPSSVRRPHVLAPVARWLVIVLLSLAACNHHAAGSSPMILRFDPTSGPVGTSVSILATGLIPPYTISFGGVAVTNYAAVNGQISAEVPIGAQTGPITIAAADGSDTTATDFTVTPPPPGTPIANVTAATAKTTTGGDQPGVFTVSLSIAPTVKTTIYYSLGGDAINGVDFTRLTGKVKIKPHKTSATVQIVPKGDLGGAGKKTVKLFLETGDGYAVGDDVSAKIKIKRGD